MVSHQQLVQQVAQLKRQFAEQQAQLAEQHAQLAEQQAQLAEQQAQLAQLMRDINVHTRQIAEQQAQLGQQQGQIGKQQAHSMQLVSRLNFVERDVKFLLTQRAVTVANQVMFGFIGEQPQGYHPCNFFSGLKDSALIITMLKEVFATADYQRARYNLLRRFDLLAEERNAIAHPVLGSPSLLWEIGYLVQFLRLEQGKGLMDWRQEICLEILSAFQPYPFGLSHEERVTYAR